VERQVRARLIGKALPVPFTRREARWFVGVVLGLAALAFSASGAMANEGTATISCTSVVFDYVFFPPTTGNTVQEFVTVDGVQVVATSFTFDGTSASHTVPLNLAPGSHSIVVHGEWDTNGATGFINTSQDVSCGSPPQGPCTVNGFIKSGFNGTAVVGVSSGPAYIWFNSNLSVKGGITAGTSIFLTDSKVLINGAPQTVPDAKITFAAVSCATTTFDAGTKTWVTTVPLAGSDEIFISGMAFPVTNLPGGAAVSWQGTFGTDQPGLCLSWKWGAAAYTSFPSDYNDAKIKPTHQAACIASNGDHAGTPQNPTVRASVTGGARGGGGSNFTGSWSGTGTQCPICP